MLIDSHCHVNFAEYKNEIDEIIKRAHDNETWLINIGSNFATSRKSIEIAEKYEQGVYATVGCHPIHLTKDIIETATFDKKEYKFTTKKEEVDFAKYKELVESSKKVVAIGEVGLDYFRLSENGTNLEEVKPIQRQVFEGFIDLAQELKLPLVIHARGAETDPYGVYDEIIDILEHSIQNTEHSGVIHCYGGNLVQARKFIELGFYIGFTGIVTFKNAKELQNIAKELPLDKILIETDAPFLAPDPYRGKRNEPLYVQYVAKKIAELKEIAVDEVANQTTDNAKKLFNI